MLLAASETQIEGMNTAVSALITRSLQLFTLTQTLATTIENLPGSEAILCTVVPSVLDFRGDRQIQGGGMRVEPFHLERGTGTGDFFWQRDGQGTLQRVDAIKAPHCGESLESWYDIARHLDRGQWCWTYFPSPSPGESRLICTVPLYKEEFFGAVRVDWSPASLQAWVASCQQMMGGEVWLVDRHDHILLTGTPSPIQPFQSLAELVDQDPALLPLLGLLAELAQPPIDLPMAFDPLGSDGTNPPYHCLDLGTTSFSSQPTTAWVFPISPLGWNLVVMQPKPGQFPPMETALRNSDAKLRAMFAAMDDFIAVYDRQGHCLEIIPTNPQVLFSTGEDQIGKNIHDYLPKAVADLHQDAFDRALAEGKAANLDYQLTIQDRFLWFSGKVFPLSEDSVLLVSRDVTEQRQGAIALRASESELQSILAAMPDVTLILDSDGRHLKVLAPTEDALLVAPRSELIHKTLAEVLPPDQASLALDKIREALATRQIVPNVEYSLTIAGQQEWFSAVISPLSDTTVIWVARNITDRKRTEEALRQSEVRFRALVDAIPDLMLCIDQNGTYLDVSPPKNFTMLGADLVGKNEYDVMPRVLAERRMGFVAQALASGQMQLYETEIDIEGQLHHEESRVVPINHNEVLVIVRDISDRKRSELALQESLHQLAIANQEITQLNLRLESENLRMGAELAVTRQLQQMILPREEELGQIANLDIAGFMEPAEEVGGDYYDVLRCNGHVKIGIGDVTGHGLESGVLMLMVQTAVRTLLTNQEADSVKFWNTINQVIYENARRMNCDRNLTLALLDYHQGTLSLSGQHEEVLVVRSNGEVERIDTFDLGFPLGLIEDISSFVAKTEFRLQTGDGFVLYTDGITEAENSTKEHYGVEQLCQIISRHWQKSAKDIRQAVVKDVHRHIGNHRVYDDITLVVIKQQ